MRLSSESFLLTPCPCPHTGSQRPAGPLERPPPCPVLKASPRQRTVCPAPASRARGQSTSELAGLLQTPENAGAACSPAGGPCAQPAPCRFRGRGEAPCGAKASQGKSGPGSRTGTTPRGGRRSCSRWPVRRRGIDLGQGRGPGGTEASASPSPRSGRSHADPQVAGRRWGEEEAAASPAAPAPSPRGDRSVDPACGRLGALRVNRRPGRGSGSRGEGPAAGAAAQGAAGCLRVPRGLGSRPPFPGAELRAFPRGVAECSQPPFKENRLVVMIVLDMEAQGPPGPWSAVVGLAWNSASSAL
ncbi:uncharacterized protein LOC120360134 isoform X2 [Saimiri boliviensis]|uniref:uncharacterized protein LOC120360134 isoform X2 n=1 Tax=Saimiri boliviensis TaxID=27679 RepID=UPI003D77BF62